MNNVTSTTKSTNLLTIRACAEGINKGRLMAAIMEASESAKTWGWYQPPAAAAVTSAELAQAVEEEEGGWFLEGQFLEGPAENLLSSAPIGAELYFQSPQQGDLAFVEIRAKSQEGWIKTRTWSADAASFERQVPLCLYSGIRKDTANMVGVETSSTFHALFDECVDEVYAAC